MKNENKTARVHAFRCLNPTSVFNLGSTSSLFQYGIIAKGLKSFIPKESREAFDSSAIIGTGICMENLSFVLCPV